MVRQYLEARTKDGMDKMIDNNPEGVVLRVSIDWPAVPVATG